MGKSQRAPALVTANQTAEPLQTAEREIPRGAAAAYADLVSGELQADALSQSPASADVIEVKVGGVFVATDRPSAPGTLLTLDLRFSDTIPPVRALARVEHVNGLGMGVSFLDVWGPRAERAIERMSAPDETVNVAMRGDLANVPIASLLMFAELERRTGMLQLTRDGEAATLYLRAGAVVRIDLAPPHDRLQGLARFFHLLDWENGRFELVSAPVLADDTLQLSTTHVLLEHARQRDEASAR